MFYFIFNKNQIKYRQMKRRFKFQQCACFHICISFYGHDCILTVSSTGALFVPPIWSTIINRDEKKTTTCLSCIGMRSDLHICKRNEWKKKNKMALKSSNAFVSFYLLIIKMTTDVHRNDHIWTELHIIKYDHGWLFQTKDKNSPFFYEPKKIWRMKKNMLRSSRTVFKWMHRIVVYLIKTIKMYVRINNKQTKTFETEIKKWKRARPGKRARAEKNSCILHYGNMIIIAIFIECKDRKNHEKNAKHWNQYMEMLNDISMVGAYQSIYLSGPKYEIRT